ncbi:rod-binding protein [Candidatus Desantisbacteria bacterium]|nr:rod-binding protein [Candidatus Desantisbacteria bacterium]
MNTITPINGLDTQFNKILNYQTMKNTAGLSGVQMNTTDTTPPFFIPVTGVQQEQIPDPDRARDLELRKERLQEASYNLEAIFVNMLLDEMRKSTGKTEMFHGGYAEGMWEDMLYDEYARNMAKSNKFGIANTIYHSMEKYL